MVSAFLGYGRAMWSLAAPWLFLDILCQGALFGNAGCSDRCPVPELLVGIWPWASCFGGESGISIGDVISQGPDLFPFFHNTKVAR